MPDSSQAQNMKFRNSYLTSALNFSFYQNPEEAKQLPHFTFIHSSVIVRLFPHMLAAP
jgi:hypothetical protein